ncbi:retrovirus-related pol polyprotein from transposon TNT 1-94 [Tanacetum coccineum]
MSTLNQQTLADSGANERPPMLEKGNYIPWENIFRRFLDNKLKEGEKMWNSLQNGPYVRPMIPDLDDDVNINGIVKQILEPTIRTTCSSIQSMKTAKNHDPLALIAHSNASSSQSHANSSYSPQPYFVTHPLLVVEYEDEYQGELQGDSQEDKLTTAMMNQAVIQDGRVDIQTKNVGYGGNDNKNAGRQSRNQAFKAGNGNDDNNQFIQRVPQTESTPRKANVQCYNCNEKGYYARDCQKPRVRDAEYF